MKPELVTQPVAQEELMDIIKKLGYIPLAKFIQPQGHELASISKFFKISKSSVTKYINFLDKVQQYITEDIGSVDLMGFGIRTQEGSVRILDAMVGPKKYYQYDGLFFGIKCSDFLLKFAITNFGLHLEHLEVTSDKRNKGFGSLILDIILDVADEMNIMLSCVPTDLVGYDTELGRIRNFYVRKGFKRHNEYLYKYRPN